MSDHYHNPTHMNDADALSDAARDAAPDATPDAMAGVSPEASPELVTIKRRDALKFLAAAASLPVLDGFTPAETNAQAAAQTKPAAAASTLSQAPTGVAAGPRGTPSDPDLLNAKATWTRKLTASELATLTALCDVIIPADAKSPSASAVGVPAYLNEHVSAPYDGNQRDLIRMRGGIVWINAESKRRFGKSFAQLKPAEKTQICDDICYLPKAKPEFRAAARFFDLVRDLSATAFYTTDAGMKDIGYVGNVALPKFDPPPASVLKHLGLA